MEFCRDVLWNIPANENIRNHVTQTASNPGCSKFNLSTFKIHRFLKGAIRCHPQRYYWLMKSQLI